MIEVDEDHIELSDDPEVRLMQLSSMFTSLMFSVCDETDTNFCQLAVTLTRQIVANMILNGHGKCANGLRHEIEEAIKFMSKKTDGETAH